MTDAIGGMVHLQAFSFSGEGSLAVEGRVPIISSEIQRHLREVCLVAF